MADSIVTTSNAGGRAGTRWGDQNRIKHAPEIMGFMDLYRLECVVCALHCSGLHIVFGMVLNILQFGWAPDCFGRHSNMMGAQGRLRWIMCM